MENYCAISKNHTCLKWLDYVITRQELEEADSLCHGNWIEIQRKNQYIQTLSTNPKIDWQTLKNFDYPRKLPSSHINYHRISEFTGKISHHRFCRMQLNAYMDLGSILLSSPCSLLLINYISSL